ncbi:MAG: hypothetical protein LUC30_02245 [Clostridiales bacterium]|nr:hypothetical protein [Clostridiales bacterium]
MGVLKKIGSVCFWLLIVALLCLPVGLIFQISEAEMAQYEASEVPTLQQTAYGSPVQVERMDIRESITLSGTFVSDTWADMELSISKTELLRWSVAAGDQIAEGDVLGTYNGKDITSTLTGIIQDINVYSGSTNNQYIRVKLLEPVMLECDVTQEQLETIQKYDDLTLADGTALSLEYVSLTRNEDDTTTVRLSLDDGAGYQYGQVLKEFPLYTGVTYPQTLVLSEQCVYQKTEGDDQPWYARRVTENGIFIEEIQVQVSGSYDGMVRISGVEEGDWFDSGYKAVLEAG